jgi:hypothetical protein
VLWAFQLDPENQGEKLGWHTRSFDDSAWPKLSILSWWESQLDKEYDGIGWYRAQARTGATGPGRRLWLELGAVDESCWVYVNGALVGQQVFDTKADDLAWEKPRRFDITDAAAEGEITVAVKVQDLFGMGGIYRGAVIRPVPANRLPRGATWAVEPWSMEYQEDGRWHDAGKAASETAEVTVDNGMYVGEPAIRVNKTGATPIRLTRRFPVVLPPGRWQCSIRVQQRPLQSVQSGPAIAAVFAAGPRSGSVRVSPASVEVGRWVSAAGDLEVAVGDEAAAVDVRIELKEPGIYLVDEVAIRAGP